MKNEQKLEGLLLELNELVRMRTPQVYDSELGEYVDLKPNYKIREESTTESVMDEIVEELKLGWEYEIVETYISTWQYGYDSWCHTEEFNMAVKNDYKSQSIFTITGQSTNKGNRTMRHVTYPGGHSPYMPVNGQSYVEYPRESWTIESEILGDEFSPISDLEICKSFFHKTESIEHLKINKFYRSDDRYDGGDTKLSRSFKIKNFAY